MDMECKVDTGRMVEQGHKVDTGHMVEQGHTVDTGHRVEQAHKVSTGHKVNRLVDIAQNKAGMARKAHNAANKDHRIGYSVDQIGRKAFLGT